MALSLIKNGNEGSPPELGPGVVKIVVIGESKVGKTSLIQAYCNHHEPGEKSSYKGVNFYRCEFAVDDRHGRAAIFEIPGAPEFHIEQRKPHYKDAKVIVLMYAIDDPLSLELLSDRWLPEIGDDLEGKPVVVVGNKTDLRDDQQVIERLAIDENKPVTPEQVEHLFEYEEIKTRFELTTRNLEEVNKVFDLIFDMALNNKKVFI